jgi:hypothetical protein
MKDERIGAFGGMRNNGKQKCSEETCPSAFFDHKSNKIGR